MQIFDNLKIFKSITTLVQLKLLQSYLFSKNLLL